jgi:hypothetical protein
MNAVPWNRLDPPLLVQALSDALTPLHLASLATCLGFAVLAQLLAVSTARALTGQPERGSAKPLRLGLAGALAALPPAAPALALAGLAGARGWPVPSLMPTERGDGPADFLWFWLPPLLLLASWQTAGLLTSPGRRRSSLRAVAGAWLLNDALALFPDLATPARAIHADHPVLLALAFMDLFLLLAGAWALACLRRPQAHAAGDHARRVLEGALVLGHTPSAAWRRHRLPELVRLGLSRLARLLAWIVMALGNTALLASLPGLDALHQAGTAFLEQPARMMPAVAPFLLCALSLSVIARMLQILPRAAPPSAKP